MDARKISWARALACVCIAGAFALYAWAPALNHEAWAEGQAGPASEGPAMIVKGCQMIWDGLNAFDEKKDVDATRKLLADACKLLSQGRELMMQDEKLMMSSERLSLGLEMMVSGCKMINYGLKKIEDKTDQSDGKKLVTEGKTMVVDGKKLFDEGIAKVAPK